MVATVLIMLAAATLVVVQSLAGATGCRARRARDRVLDSAHSPRSARRPPCAFEQPRYRGTSRGTNGGGMARTHVILSDEVIAAIEERVGERGRSRFLEEAAREKLERLELEAAIRDGAGMLKDRDYPHWRDTDSVKEWVRASRRGELTADDVPAR
jgi:hypothetical protein